MTREQTMELLKRIKTSPHGMDFLSYLEQLSLDNYKAFKRCSSEMNDIHKGYALAIDNLLQSFESCDKQVIDVKINETP